MRSLIGAFCLSLVIQGPAQAVHKQGRPYEVAVETALRQKGTPYSWGGSRPRTGFDCSGLAQWSWRRAGVRIPRTTGAIWQRLHRVRWADRRPGDLLLFYRVSHVGMYIGRGRMIHSPHSGDHVRVARIKGYYRRHLVGVVRPRG